MIFRQAFTVGIAAMIAQSAASAGVLDRINAGGKLVIAYTESSVPFSYLDPASGKPVGYALDLCQKLAEAVRQKTGKKEMGVTYLQVTSANRIASIEQGKADLECGSTTNNAERRQRVAFTVPHAVIGARILVRANSPIIGLNDLKGKKLVSTKGTSPLQVVTQANKTHLMGITIMEAPDHEKAFEMVDKGEADAFVMGDVLLYGLIAGHPNSSAFKVVGKYLTTEPLAIMLPKGDTAFKQLIDAEMKRIISSREIYPIYDKWFMRPIPPGLKLNLPMNHLTRDNFRFPSSEVML